MNKVGRLWVASCVASPSRIRGPAELPSLPAVLSEHDIYKYVLARPPPAHRHLSRKRRRLDRKGTWIGEPRPQPRIAYSCWYRSA